MKHVHNCCNGRPRWPLCCLIGVNGLEQVAHGDGCKLERAPDPACNGKRDQVKGHEEGLLQLGLALNGQVLTNRLGSCQEILQLPQLPRCRLKRKPLVLPMCVSLSHELLGNANQAECLKLCRDPTQSTQ
mgnify:CR=1 FL=1